jgi:hypothetical protein
MRPALSIAGILLLAGVWQSCSKPPAAHLLPNGTPCTTDSDCQSDICGESADGAVKFCTIFCKQQSDCASTFTGGCCYPAEPGQGLCAIAQFCLEHGDAGLGDACPNHSECSPDLICVYSSDNSVSECTRPCDETHGCDNVAEECCEPLSSAASNYCVIDNICANGVTTGTTTGTTGTTGATGTTSATGTTGTTSSTGGVDAGPVTVTLTVDGHLTGTTHQWLGSVVPGGDTLVMPPVARNIQIQLPVGLVPGHYDCAYNPVTPVADGGITPLDGGSSDGGTSDGGVSDGGVDAGVDAGVDGGVDSGPTTINAVPDGGPALYAAVSTTSDGTSVGFVGALPLYWQGFTFGTVCGPGKVSGAPDAVVEAVNLDFSAFTPGYLSQVDGGDGQAGHVTGSIYWKVVNDGSTLEVQGSFDVDLVVP